MGSLHLMRGRVHFGYILGWTTLATLAMYWLLNQLGAHGEGIEPYRCGSIIGYRMLPMPAWRRSRRSCLEGSSPRWWRGFWCCGAREKPPCSSCGVSRTRRGSGCGGVPVRRLTPHALLSVY